MVDHISVMDRVDSKSAVNTLVPGVLALLSAIPVAFLIHLVNRTLPDQPERAVLVVGVLFAFLVALPPAVYLLLRRRAAEPARLGLIVLATVAVLLVAIYFYWVSSFIFFRADVLIWSESEFVNDILKFRVGYPLYTDQRNNESFSYTPGSQTLTYLLAWLSGNATSIPMYRMIQVGYTLLAAVVAALCCRRLVEMSPRPRRFRDGGLWGAILLPIFFLVATNSLTNPFVHNLHNDALGQLVSVVAYWLLLEYVSTRHRRVVALMAIVPAVGFMVKQNLAIWAVLYCLHLALFDRPRSIARLVTFAVAAFGCIGVTVLGGYLVWGEHFLYWVFVVFGKLGVSPLRAFEHLLDVWVYVVIGLFGGVVLVRGKQFDVLIGPWLIWLALILLEIYTSGVAWMLNHIGPGSLIAGIWFLGALIRVWPLGLRVPAGALWGRTWVRAGIAVTVVCLLFGGLGVVRIPTKPLSDDAYRYIGEIEREFEGYAAEDVLLDMGTWVYVPDGVIMKDRLPSIGDRGKGETGDFSGMLSRLEHKRYAKILVRNFHSPDFQYDWYLWRRSSGIRQALLDNYHETARIREVSGESYQYDTYSFREISILAPNSD